MHIKKAILTLFFVSVILFSTLPFAYPACQQKDITDAKGLFIASKNFQWKRTIASKDYAIDISYCTCPELENTTLMQSIYGKVNATIFNCSSCNIPQDKGSNQNPVCTSYFYDETFLERYLSDKDKLPSLQEPKTFPQCAFYWNSTSWESLSDTRSFLISSGLSSKVSDTFSIISSAYLIDNDFGNNLLMLSNSTHHITYDLESNVFIGSPKNNNVSGFILDSNPIDSATYFVDTLWASSNTSLYEHNSYFSDDVFFNIPNLFKTIPSSISSLDTISSMTNYYDTYLEEQLMISNSSSIWTSQDNFKKEYTQMDHGFKGIDAMTFLDTQRLILFANCTSSPKIDNTMPFIKI